MQCQTGCGLVHGQERRLVESYEQRLVVELHTSGFDMWPHVRRYADYITEKITSYRVMAFDFCKVKRGRDDGLLRTMATDNVRIDVTIT